MFQRRPCLQSEVCRCVTAKCLQSYQICHISCQGGHCWQGRQELCGGQIITYRRSFLFCLVISAFFYRSKIFWEPLHLIIPLKTPHHSRLLFLRQSSRCNMRKQKNLRGEVFVVFMENKPKWVGAVHISHHKLLENKIIFSCDSSSRNPPVRPSVRNTFQSFKTSLFLAVNFAPFHLCTLQLCNFATL